MQRHSQPYGAYQYHAVGHGHEPLVKPASSPYLPYTPASSTFSPDPKSEHFPLTGISVPRPDEKGDQHYRKLSRRCRCDCGALTLCILIWLFIAGSIVSFIVFSNAKRNEAGWVDGDTVALAFVVALACSAIAAILNDTLVDRCWRRIRAQAVRGNMRGQHLRAANFDLADAMKRIAQGKISKREMATLVSYTLLRWGTLSGLPVIQLTVDYERNPDTPTLFFTHMREHWIPIPIILHMVSVILALAICGLPPWAIVVNNAYGSAASSDQVADLLDATNNQPHDFSSLAINHRPGPQLLEKTRGILSGAFIILLIPSILYGFQHMADQTGVPLSRFAYSYG